MITETISDLSRTGSTTPWILPRPAWQSRLFTAVALPVAVLAEMPHTAAVAVVLIDNLIGAGR
jgi:hypothetical protein